MRNLLKALLTTGGATIVAQALGLVVNKILALQIGTAGIGFYSLVRQTHDTAVGMGSVGAGGLIQGLAAREGSARHRLLRAAALLTVLCAAIVAVALTLAPDPVAAWLFDRSNEETLSAVSLVGITAALGIVYVLLTSVINAARAIGLLALLGVGGAAMTAALAWPVAQQAGQTPWLLLALIGVPLLAQIAVALFALRRLGWRLGDLLVPEARPGAGEFRHIAGFFGFNFTLGLIASAATLAVRSGIVHAQDLAGAGLFAAAWGIGMQSMSLVLSSFGTYVLPTVAAASGEQRQRALQDAATLVVGLTLPLLVTLLVLKGPVVRLLFTAEFLPAVELLQWLLIGNYVKALSWVMAMPLLATSDLRRLFVIEAGWYLAFAAGAMLALEASAWLSGIGISYVASYAVYFVAATALARSRIGFRLSARSLWVFVAGLALLAAVAVVTWNETAIRWPLALALPLVACGLTALSLTPHQRGRARDLVLGMVRR